MSRRTSLVDVLMYGCIDMGSYVWVFVEPKSSINWLVALRLRDDAAARLCRL